MRYLIPLLLTSLLTSCMEPVHMKEVSYEGREHILVKTLELDYYYDVQGGGFSRIIDREGKDWVGFKMEPWGEYPASAASSFRGLPNLVFQGEDDGAGHPGHTRCISKVDGRRIITESLSGKWKWTWEFYDDHAVLEVQKTDPGRAYWFLYEGTPGGSFDPENSYFGSDLGGPFAAAHDYYKGDILWGHFHWIYAGNKTASGTFFLLHEEPDDLTDMISFLGNMEEGLDSADGMTVFGFGRDKDTSPLLLGPQRFVIGWYPEKITDPEDHQTLGSHLENLLKNLR